ncbi:imelysin family protein [Aquimarina macrocephali]|uniref:imelysin family protein n=1 Tax=Aquimarina macrocephali TaxID=666563 RepID=UPI00046666C0|nr:imelysin family protein [Aquimarina macrocephali]
MNFSIKKIYTTVVLLGVIISSSFISCEDDSEYTSEVQFYKKNQLTNIYTNEIAPLNVNFVEQSELLEQSIKRFQNEITLANLQLVQEQWKAVQLVWKQLELYDLGNVANSFISFEINRWPTDTQRIDENIIGTEVLNTNFIASIGSSSKGISGIEYLIFSSEGKTATLNRFTTDENAVRRLEYLVALSENLKTKSVELKNLWETNEESFTSALENGISGSQNQIINAMVTLIEEIIISKLGSPLGDSNGGTIESERLEAYYSGFSKEILQQHLVALKRCYTGDFAQTPFRVGFDDFLTLIGSENFSNKIITQFSVCQSRLDDIKGTLKEEITSNPEAVTALKDSFRDLLVLVKVDMANVLGSTITFNDNDGD